MRRLRVLIAGVDQLLGDILMDGLSRDSRLAVERFTGVCEWHAMTAAARWQEPDVILLGDHIPASTEDQFGLLCRHPSLVVMTLRNGGRIVRLHRLRLDTKTIANAGVPEIIGTIVEHCGAAIDS